MSEAGASADTKVTDRLADAFRLITWKNAYPRLPNILVAFVYFLLAIVAPQQILDLVELTWSTGGSAGWPLFILPVLICSVASLVIMMSRVEPHRIFDTIVTAAPLAGISLLVAKSVSAGLWFSVALVIVALLVAWWFLKGVDENISDEVREKRIASRKRNAVGVVVGTMIVWGSLALLIGLLPISVPISLGLGVVTIGVGLCGLGLSVCLMWPRASAIYLLVCAFCAFFVGEYNLVPTTVKYAENGERLNDKAPYYSQDTALYAWLTSRKDIDDYRKANKPYPIIISSSEGGGIYASSHAYLALSKMAATCPSFSQHLFATVGVSGGSLGNLLFAAYNKDQATNAQLKPCILNAKEPNTSPLTQDLLSPLLANLLILQSLDFLVPYVQIAPDGGEILARALQETNPKKTMISQALEKTWKPDAATPLLVFVSTDVNNGNRFVFAPFTDFTSDAAEIFPDIAANRGAVTSARFPWLTSTARLKVDKDEYRVLADGGYFDNSGADTVIDIIEHIRAAADQSQKPCEDGEESKDTFSCSKQLIVEKSFKGTVEWKPNSIHVFIAYMPMHSTGGELPDMMFAGAPSLNQSYLLDPISTMLSTRNTRGVLALSRARRVISGYDDPVNVEGLGVDIAYFQDRISPLDQQLPLGWRLGAAKVEMMKEFAAPLPSCTFLPNLENDWRKFFSDAPPEPHPEQQMEEDEEVEGAFDERKQKLDQFKLDNACNMAMLAWLFNPTEDPDAVAIPRWN